ncbi:MAG: hypothetical protein WBF53_08630 [Litorimonas sp.]
MSVTTLWRYALIGIWVLYIIALIRIVPLFLHMDDPSATALAAFDLFSQTFAVPVGIGTAFLLLFELRRPKRERQTVRDDERKKALWSRSAKGAMWTLLVANVLALSVGRHADWHLPIVVLGTILAFGVVFCLAAADEIELMVLEERAD